MKELEIGQHYIRSNRTGRRRVKPHEIVTIVGKVDPSTEEFKQGFRYYSSFGEFFGQFGESYLDPKIGGKKSKGNSLDRNLEFVADDIDLNEGVQERHFIDIKDVTRRFPHMFISSDNSDFTLKSGTVYVNRMGFLALIERTQEFADSRRIRYFDHQFGYNERGKRRGNEISMRDLVLQRI
jgi:hypothetical protein